MKRGRTMPKVEEGHRVSVNFSPSTYKALEELAHAEGENLSDALRDAIALSKWFLDTKREGGKILVERNGAIREIVRV
jgi:hypothetical protein